MLLTRRLLVFYLCILSFGQEDEGSLQGPNAGESTQTLPQRTDDENRGGNTDRGGHTDEHMKINYALRDKGADVLEFPNNAKGAGSLVVNDKDKYFRGSITDLRGTNTSVVIQLSEEINVSQLFHCYTESVGNIYLPRLRK